MLVLCGLMKKNMANQLSKCRVNWRAKQSYDWPFYNNDILW